VLTVKIPQNLSLTEAVNFCNRLWQTEQVEEVMFDFSRLGHVEPFTMAFVAAEISRFTELRSDTSFFANNFEHHTYAAHMGFFKAFGLDYGNEPGEASGSSTYIPLTIVQVDDLQRRAVESYESVGNVIEGESNKLAKILTRQHDGALVDTLTYSFREIMRNAVEHSQSSVLEYCAQYWPTKNKVEMVVLDSGIGIQASLANNPHLTISSDREALQLALMPTVSGKTFKGMRRRNNDVWQNSGFGLYMTNRLCRNGGSFFICSGSSGILLDPKGKSDVRTSFQGTALRMVMNTQKMAGLRDRLDRYRKEGYAMAKRFSPGTLVEPSVASTMLSRDFADES
jgi:hypothetical protein